MQEQLEHITRFIEEEIRHKQDLIDQQADTILRLQKSIEEHQQETHRHMEQLNEYQKVSDGNRQLINKLLGDLSKLQQDLDWYKRTYEERSFLGTIMEKIRRRF
ncbi:hypothetical protein ACFSQD_16525 [Flavihumibacter stibioxidans]|uniref:Uncharacterized protein n=1 Tax=Flavihumibacter stibioxidans TaxID=1834163 RepID=A0ABR7M6X4_9BACT|nr:hypothetical protein [Flavihumibacter stibioxidans]MBC6490786.1 hypothetical protein [Flavihumibacter stibioxidans]